MGPTLPRSLGGFLSVAPLRVASLMGMELMGTCDINGYITITIYGTIIYIYILYYIYIHNIWEYETISGNIHIYIYIWEIVGILKH